MADDTLPETVEDTTQPEATGFKQHKRRWLMLIICFWINVVIQIIFITFAPLATVSAQYYDVTVNAINWLALIWFALFPPFALVAAWAFEKYGMRHCLLVAGGTLTLSTAIRCMSIPVGVTNGQKNNGFAYAAVLIGSWLAGMAQPAIMSSTTLLASAWFSERQRALANGLLAVASPLGLAIGSVLSPSVVPGADPKKLDMLLVVHLLLAGSAMALVFGLQDHPPTPPSHTAHRPALGQRFKADLQSLGMNLPFIALCNVFSLALGTVQALLTVIEQMLNPMGYSTDDAGMISAVMIVMGIIGAGIAGPVLDHTRAYKKVIAISLSLALPCMVLFVLLAHQHNRIVALGFLAGLMGFFGFPVLTACLDASSEVTYPVSGSLTTGILWTGAQLTSLLLVLLISGPLKMDNEDGSYTLEAGMWLLIACLGAATVLAWLWTGKYVRREAEAAGAHMKLAVGPSSAPVRGAGFKPQNTAALGSGRELTDIPLTDIPLEAS